MLILLVCTFGQQFTGAIKTKDDVILNNYLWNLITNVEYANNKQSGLCSGHTPPALD